MAQSHRLSTPSPFSLRPRSPGLQSPPSDPGFRAPAPSSLRTQAASTSGHRKPAPSLRTCDPASQDVRHWTPPPQDPGVGATSSLNPRAQGPGPFTHHSCGCLQAQGAPAQDKNHETHHCHPVERGDWTLGSAVLQLPTLPLSLPHPRSHWSLTPSFWSLEDQN